MILDLDQIKDIIINNPNKKVVDAGVQYSKKLRRHIYGEDLDKHMDTIEGYEKDDLKKMRVKYTKSNKDLFSRLSRPIDKVFSARGGSLYYNLSDSNERKARLLSQDVRNGLSIRKWVETIWKPHMLDDPFGMIFMEILPVQQAMLAKQQSQSYVYPTYKPISDVYDYLPKGNKFEYIIFKLTSTDKKKAGLQESDIVFRVVDDAFDYYIKRDGDNVTVLAEYTIQNYFGEVPGIVNSDIQNPQADYYFLSLFDEIIELADQFLLKGSIKVTHDFLHGFPKYSEFADTCPTCRGTKFDGADPCKACGGTGKKLMMRVSDAKLLEWPTKDEPLILPTQVGGYISPDKTFYEIATDDLSSLEDAMSVTLWGTQSKLKTSGMNAGTGSATSGQPVTATQIMDEIKPQSDRLIPVSEMAETRHKFILDYIIQIQIAPAYQGSSVNYGRRYMLEGPDEIWLKYQDARTKGAPINVLDDLLNEYFDAKYQSDPVGLMMAKKLMYVEPFVHYTSIQLKPLNPAPEDWKAKLYFGEWLSLQNEAIIISNDIPTLRQMLNDYAAAKNVVEDKPQPIAA